MIEGKDYRYRAMRLLKQLLTLFSPPAIERSVFRCRECGATHRAIESVCPECGGKVEEHVTTSFPQYLGPME